MTDISKFIENGGVIKRAKPARADGCNIWYSLPSGIRALKSTPARTPSHMGTKGDGRYWETKK